MLVITGISNEQQMKYEILCRNDTIFYRQEPASLFPVKDELKTCRNSKWTFSASCFVAGDSHVKVVWLHSFKCPN